MGIEERTIKFMVNVWRRGIKEWIENSKNDTEITRRELEEAKQRGDTIEMEQKAEEIVEDRGFIKGLKYALKEGKIMGNEIREGSFVRVVGSLKGMPSEIYKVLCDKNRGLILDDDMGTSLAELSPTAVERVEECSICHGEGSTTDHHDPCTECNGKGWK